MILVIDKNEMEESHWEWQDDYIDSQKWNGGDPKSGAQGLDERIRIFKVCILIYIYIIKSLKVVFFYSDFINANFYLSCYFCACRINN